MKKLLISGIAAMCLVVLTGFHSPQVYKSDFNFYDLPRLPLEEELLETAFEQNDVRIERIISTGQVTDGWYNQEEHEYVVLLDGKAQIEYENGDTVNLAAGDTLLIPAHEKHRVSYTSTEPACIWLCVFWK